MNIKFKNEYSYLPDCTAVKSLIELFDIPRAVGLWCGVKEEHLNKFLQEVQHTGRGIYKHEKIPCVLIKSQAIYNAIESKELPVYREYGGTTPPEDHIAAERRHIYGRDLKAWIERNFPTDKPPFLFTELERNKYNGFTIDEYQTLMTENANLKERIENAKKVYLEQQAKIKELENIIKKMKGNYGEVSTQSVNKRNGVIAAFALHISQDDSLLNTRSKAIAQRIINEVAETLAMKGINGNFISDAALAEYISEGMDIINP